MSRCAPRNTAGFNGCFRTLMVAKGELLCSPNSGAHRDVQCIVLTVAVLCRALCSLCGAHCVVLIVRLCTLAIGVDD